MSRKPQKSAAAFTIIELLLGLAITGMLLVAVAAAFAASLTNYQANEDIFKTVNNARQALFRITTELRGAYQGMVLDTAPLNECSFYTPDGQNITYRYNSADQSLYLITNDDLTDPDYVLCDNVTAMTFTKNVVVEDTEIKVKSVQITITVQSGNVRQTLSAAAVVRTNL
ncbi:MAG: hypothetical protein ACYTBJ_03220 [Planctomycetota bacterium]|jgi:type II secretory pathway pseudopilin PulG